MLREKTKLEAQEALVQINILAAAQPRQVDNQDMSEYSKIKIELVNTAYPELNDERARMINDIMLLDQKAKSKANSNRES